jgi:hypothetical protein
MIERGDQVKVKYDGRTRVVDVKSVRKDGTVRVAFGDYMDAVYRIEDVSELKDGE